MKSIIDMQTTIFYTLSSQKGNKASETQVRNEIYTQKAQQQRNKRKP